MGSIEPARIRPLYLHFTLENSTLCTKSERDDFIVRMKPYLVENGNNQHQIKEGTTNGVIDKSTITPISSTENHDSEESDSLTQADLAEFRANMTGYLLFYAIL